MATVLLGCCAVDSEVPTLRHAHAQLGDAQLESVLC